ncbi:uncharacterized protein BO80DRAFT_40149 [Aspergillus ibericus CBS 121593]|uniref:Uncharacterized protein n=1 Tax=Aspergillus ibericus CBS 121593 TaxID=1448316 RepID=A0A395H3A8_9EURO|nr:hypothetical protein BO80DRAFT_40149 [Aspergillus ibericus CBS 121593]RAL02123.1 hypothetical protein BO80DRAFT_40149 [Aspergillus ibericus CBS 121593]
MLRKETTRDAPSHDPSIFVTMVGPVPSLGRSPEELELPIMGLLLSPATMRMTPRDARRVTLFAQLIVTIAAGINHQVPGPLRTKPTLRQKKSGPEPSFFTTPSV